MGHRFNDVTNQLRARGAGTGAGTGTGKGACHTFKLSLVGQWGGGGVAGEK